MLWSLLEKSERLLFCIRSTIEHTLEPEVFFYRGSHYSTEYGARRDLRLRQLTILFGSRQAERRRVLLQLLPLLEVAEPVFCPSRLG